MKIDWREPFLGLKEELRSLYKGSSCIYHGVLLSTNRTRTELEPSIGWLEPAIAGRELLREIRLETPGCVHHSHVFYGSNSSGLLRLEQVLDGIEEWMDRTPGGTLPSFDIPSVETQADRNLLRWVSIVYYIAERADAPYLDYDVEFQMDIRDLYFATWHHCPQPPKCRPLDWLICRSSARDQIPKMKEQFAKRKEQFPDLIDAFLPADFITSSMAAIDQLTAVLHRQEKQQGKAMTKQDYLPRLRKGEKAKKIRQQVERLRAILSHFHNPQENTDMDVNPEMPLTSDQIAEKLLLKGDARKVQSEVSRLMKRIFGPKPMIAYRAELKKAIRAGHPDGTSLLHRYLSRHEVWPQDE